VAMSKLMQWSDCLVILFPPVKSNRHRDRNALAVPQIASRSLHRRWIGEVKSSVHTAGNVIVIGLRA